MNKQPLLAALMILAVMMPGFALEELDIEQARQRASDKNPSLAVARLDPELAQGPAVAARRLEDPELSAEVQSDKQTVKLEQALSFPVLGGKEASAADLGVAVAKARFEAARRDVLAEVVRAYFVAFAAQERTRLAGEQAALDDQVAEIVTRRFKAGDAPRIEVLQAEAAALGSQDRLLEAEAVARQAEADLSVLVEGAPDARWSLKRPPIATPSPSVDWQASPEVRARETAVQQAEADLQLARARRWGGFTVSAGVERRTDLAPLLGLSAPLPIWYRQEGDVVRADAALRKARAELEAARTRARSRVAVGLERLRIGAQRVRVLESERLPRLKESYQLALQAVREGAYSIVDTLAPRREWQIGQSELLDALREQGDALAALEEFTQP